MQPSVFHAFAELFKAAISKCFGEALERPLSEPESRFMSDEIFDKTGLVIGWKSLKNYSFSVLQEGKLANPNFATLDTIARYVAEAPVISEPERKRSDTTFAYWFRYLDQYKTEEHLPSEMMQPVPRFAWARIGVPAIIAAVTLILVFLHFTQKTRVDVVEDFSKTDAADIESRGWILLGKEPAFWKQRTQNSGALTLYTLKGDNWRSQGQNPVIKNLLVQEIDNDCFRAELHMQDFIPRENWQQAGILLMEDTSFSGNCIRISLAYNDFFGGYVKPGEIIIQALAFNNNNLQQVEEIAHQPLFNLGRESNETLLEQNLRNSAVCIEQRGRNIRFLYAASPVENFSLKELAVYQSDIKPRYVGIFALRGFVDSTAAMPVQMKLFRLEEVNCSAH